MRRRTRYGAQEIGATRQRAVYVTGSPAIASSSTISYGPNFFREYSDDWFVTHNFMGYFDASTAATELSAGDVEASVALLHDYENCWALSIQPHSPDFDYWTHLEAYVADGGELLLTIRSGVADSCNKLHADLPPDLLASLASAIVVQHESFPPGHDADSIVRWRYL